MLLSLHGCLWLLSLLPCLSACLPSWLFFWPLLLTVSLCVSLILSKLYYFQCSWMLRARPTSNLQMCLVVSGNHTAFSLSDFHLGLAGKPISTCVGLCAPSQIQICKCIVFLATSLLTGFLGPPPGLPGRQISTCIGCSAPGKIQICKYGVFGHRLAPWVPSLPQAWLGGKVFTCIGCCAPGQIRICKCIVFLATGLPPGFQWI